MARGRSEKKNKKMKGRRSAGFRFDEEERRNVKKKEKKREKRLI